MSNTTVICPWDMCKFNEDGTCGKESIVLNIYIQDDDLEALTCTSFEEEEG